MIIEGSFTVNAPLEETWNFLIDFERMSVCMPGVEDVVREENGDTYTGKVTVKVGPIATSFQGKVIKTDEEAPRLLKAKLQGRDAKTASMVTGEFSSELSEPEAGKTEVAYKFDIAIRGRLGQFGQAVILDTSRQLTDEFVACVRKRVEQPDAPPESAAPQANLFFVALRAFFTSLWTNIKSVFSPKKENA
jgi:carbon monoxide dehydrogenase subunit G